MVGVLVQVGEIFVHAHAFHQETFLWVGDLVDHAALVVIDEIGHVETSDHVCHRIRVERGKTHDARDERVDQLVVADNAAAEAV